MNNKPLKVIAITVLVLVLLLIIVLWLLISKIKKPIPENNKKTDSELTISPVQIPILSPSIETNTENNNNNNGKVQNSLDLSTRGMLEGDNIDQNILSNLNPDIAFANSYFMDPQDLHMKIVPINESSRSATYRFEVYYPGPEYINNAHYSFLDLIERSKSEKDINNLEVSFIEDEKSYFDYSPKNNTKNSEDNKKIDTDKYSSPEIKALSSLFDLLNQFNIQDNGSYSTYPENNNVNITTIPANPTTKIEYPKDSSFNGLDYNIPIRDTSVQPISYEDFKAYINKSSWRTAQIQYYDFIKEYSIKNGWNPAFIMTLWVEETGASHTTLTSVGGGGGGIKRSDGRIVFSNGHTGCAPKEKQTIQQSLDCIFKYFGKYNNSQFSDFMYRYSGDDPKKGFINNFNFPKSIKYIYKIIAKE